MVRRDPTAVPIPTGARQEPDAAEALGLEEFTVPEDQGLSLDELSRAYAALLAKGADPYPDASRPGPAQRTAEDQTAEELLPVVHGQDGAACEITPRSILEAILFVGHPTGEPLASERIAALMRGVPPAEIDDLVAELNRHYDAEGAPYVILSVGPGYQMALRAEFAPLRDIFWGRIREARLSQAAIDVLAIVAYHQPIAADEIDRLRGKSSGAILSQLVRRDLLTIQHPPEGKIKKIKAQYRTGHRFLELFGLQDLSELPRSQDIEREL